MKLTIAANALLFALTTPAFAEGKDLHDKPRKLPKAMMAMKNHKSSSSFHKYKGKVYYYKALIFDPSSGKGVEDCDTVCGSVMFSKPEGFESPLTNVTYSISGLEPGLHGLHIHQARVDPDCASTMGHWNPLNTNHGSQLDAQRHLGDLGNILADQDGNAVGTGLFAHVPLDGLGQLSVVVHAGQDDLGLGGDAGSRAVGNAGARPGCGNIEEFYYYKY
eukprot:scaffold538_cov166-Amphora_coffeaeformis.AAC.5